MTEHPTQDSDISVIVRVLRSLYEEERVGDAVSFTVAIEGQAYIDRPHIRVESIDEEDQKGLLIMFQRSPAMRDFYPAIMDVLKDRGLPYKDRMRAGVKYLTINKALDVETTASFLHDLSGEKFAAPIGIDLSRNQNASIHALISRHPIMLIACVFGAMLLWALFILYEILRLGQISMPTLANIDRLELWMGALIISLHYLVYKLNKVQRKKPSPWWKYPFWALLPILAIITV